MMNWKQGIKWALGAAVEGALIMAAFICALLFLMWLDR